FRVHADKDLGDGFDVEVVIEFNQADLVGRNPAQRLDAAEHLVTAGARIPVTVGVDEVEQACLWVEHGGDIGDPGSVLLNSRVTNLELSAPRMERDAKAHALIALVDHLATEQRRHERRHSLLTVNEDAPSG